MNDFEIKDISKYACLWLGIVIGAAIPFSIIYLIVRYLVKIAK